MRRSITPTQPYAGQEEEVDEEADIAHWRDTVEAAGEDPNLVLPPSPASTRSRSRSPTTSLMNFPTTDERHGWIADAVPSDIPTAQTTPIRRLVREPERPIGYVWAAPTADIQEVMNSMRRGLMVETRVEVQPITARTWREVRELVFHERHWVPREGTGDLRISRWELFALPRRIPVYYNGDLIFEYVVPMRLDYDIVQRRVDLATEWRFVTRIVVLDPLTWIGHRTNLPTNVEMVVEREALLRGHLMERARQRQPRAGARGGRPDPNQPRTAMMTWAANRIAREAPEIPANIANTLLRAEGRNITSVLNARSPQQVRQIMQAAMRRAGIPNTTVQPEALAPEAPPQQPQQQGSTLQEVTAMVTAQQAATMQVVQFMNVLPTREEYAHLSNKIQVQALMHQEVTRKIMESLETLRQQVSTQTRREPSPAPTAVFEEAREEDDAEEGQNSEGELDDQATRDPRVPQSLELEQRSEEVPSGREVIEIESNEEEEQPTTDQEHRANQEIEQEGRPEESSGNHERRSEVEDRENQGQEAAANQPGEQRQEHREEHVIGFLAPFQRRAQEVRDRRMQNLQENPQA